MHHTWLVSLSRHSTVLAVGHVRDCPSSARRPICISRLTGPVEWLRPDTGDWVEFTHREQDASRVFDVCLGEVVLLLDLLLGENVSRGDIEFSALCRRIGQTDRCRSWKDRVVGDLKPLRVREVLACGGYEGFQIYRVPYSDAVIGGPVDTSAIWVGQLALDSEDCFQHICCIIRQECGVDKHGQWIAVGMRRVLGDERICLGEVL